MQLYSTRTHTLKATLREAVMKGLPEDNGLYMPERIPVMPKAFFEQLPELSFQEIAFRVSQAMFEGAIPDQDLHDIVNQSITFDAPLVRLDDSLRVLELFHGPTLAFKDFGARFMARLMGWFQKDSDQELTILVATSGDTGGAVAAGFHHTPGIRVVILYPSGKVSPLQEKQLTTLGGNVSALEIDGTFDDCQAIVKQAFLDPLLNQKLQLSSANSINIARLIPQSFYYFRAMHQVEEGAGPVVFCVPSGNFGNLTAGLLAARMGLPIDHFICATNSNSVIVEYLSTGHFHSRPSVQTISNAMDVGNPSNFARMNDLFGEEWGRMRQAISGFSFSDMQTRAAIREIYEKYHYVMDPHGAVGYLAAREFLMEKPDRVVVMLETAHPSKFPEVVEQELGMQVDIPERLAVLRDVPGHSVKLEARYEAVRDWLLSQ